MIRAQVGMRFSLHCSMVTARTDSAAIHHGVREAGWGRSLAISSRWSTVHGSQYAPRSFTGLNSVGCSPPRFRCTLQNSLPMEKFTRLCPVGLMLPKTAMGPTMVLAITPPFRLPRTTTGPDSKKAEPASYQAPQ